MPLGSRDPFARMSLLRRVVLRSSLYQVALCGSIQKYSNVVFQILLTAQSRHSPVLACRGAARHGSYSCLYNARAQHVPLDRCSGVGFMTLQNACVVIL